jgi:hypothetical protein
MPLPPEELFKMASDEILYPEIEEITLLFRSCSISTK